MKKESIYEYMLLKKEIDIIFRYKNRLLYKINSNNHIKIISFFFMFFSYLLWGLIFPVGGIYLLILLFFVKNTYDSEIHTNILVCLSILSVILIGLLYTTSSHSTQDLYVFFKIHLMIISSSIFGIFLLQVLSFNVLKIYFYYLLIKISKRRNNEFTCFFLRLKYQLGFKITNEMINNSNLFFQNVFYYFYQGQYPEDKHLFIEQNFIKYINHTPDDNLYTICMKNGKKCLYINYKIEEINPNKINQIIMNIKEIIYSNNDYKDFLINYLTSINRENALINQLNNPRGYHVKKKI